MELRENQRRNGADPAAERDAGRKAITVKELAERFDKEHIAIRVKASTAKEHRRNPECVILPALGQLTVTGIPRADVAKFHHDLRHIPYQANRCLEVVSKMVSLAVGGLASPNVSILSDAFLAELAQMERKHLAVEALKKLLNDELRARSRSNIVETRRFSDRLGGSHGALPRERHQHSRGAADPDRPRQGPLGGPPAR